MNTAYVITTLILHLADAKDAPFIATATRPAALAPPPPPNACRDNPPCRGRGACDAAATACECQPGYAGPSCELRVHDCAHQRSCADCQDAAHGHFCGWCAQSTYCVPKHVHWALAKRGKQCPEWHEDDCPAATSTASGSSAARPSALAASLGDDGTVLLAETLQTLVEEDPPRGPPILSLSLLVLLVALLAAWCIKNELLAANRLARFQAFMGEGSQTSGLIGPSSWTTPALARDGRRGGSEAAARCSRTGVLSLAKMDGRLPAEWMSDPEALANALAAEGDAGSPTPEPLGRDDERELRSMARTDLEARKARQRLQVEASRAKAKEAQIAHLEESVQEQLQQKAKQALAASPSAAGDSAATTAATSPQAGQVAVAVLPETARANTKAAEVEFLAALDDL